MPADLSAFPITGRWPPRHPDRLQYYGLPTPNGVKVSIALEECGLPYEAHRLDISAGEQKSAAFESLNPNGKIPAILDPDGPGGEPLALFESGAILLYLAEKTGRLLPAAAAERWRAVQWVFFQVGGVGPMFGQLGFFQQGGGADWEDRRPHGRFLDETRRLLSVMERALDGREWFAGDDFSIADIALLGWVRALEHSYHAGAIVGLDRFPRLGDWLQRGLARPAVQRGLHIPPRE
ncbi:glutathione S-transferase family protein [Sphingomonas aracearum]|uniref:Glutathione S-transferase n=1 Tax=Sphingomonas aracearum TaxID=2283317 RepID=A0A369VWW3_9SPHN|nr:glutathione binding-like protein [Sphingomonas aracearum]RDE06057.1 glutathione S-transferase [Sphingomonas aracearum]